MFQEYPPWDEEKKYTAHNIRMYYENIESGKLYPVETHKPLKEILSQETYVFCAFKYLDWIVNTNSFSYNIKRINIDNIYNHINDESTVSKIQQFSRNVY